jgi:hypothetical protein
MLVSVEAQAQPANLAGKSTHEIVKILKDLLESKGRLYNYRAPRDQRRTNNGGIIFTPPSINIFSNYKIRDTQCTKFLGFRMNSYTQSVKTGATTLNQSFIEYPEIDLGDIKTSFVRRARSSDLDEILGRPNQWSDHEVIIEFKTPTKMKSLVKGGLREQPFTFVSFCFPTKGDANYAKSLIEQITKAKFDVTDIPCVMRALAKKKNNDRWIKAAELQELWLNKPLRKNRRTEEMPIDWNMPQVPLSLDNWILAKSSSIGVDGTASNRVQESYAQIIDPTYFASDKALRVLLEHLRVRHGKPIQAGEIIKFPYTTPKPGMPVSSAFHADHIQHSNVDYKGNGEMRIPLDPLQGALGRFAFYAVPIGEAIVGEEKAHFMINAVAVYAVDSYDFKDKYQYLGYWKKPDGLELAPTFAREWTIINNRTFRDYQAKHQKGADFLLVSDVKVITQNPPLKLSLSLIPTLTEP